MELRPNMPFAIVPEQICMHHPKSILLENGVFYRELTYS